jgi:hypothetical protein
MKTLVSFFMAALLAALLLGPASSAIATGEPPAHMMFLPMISRAIPVLPGGPEIVPLCDYGDYAAHCTHTPEPPPAP